tara:strand:+ start:4341 stop:4682 length:342 start_codon:yes stop_codon:yes gene_type:complete
MDTKNIEELTILNKIVNNLDHGHHQKIFDIIKKNNVKFSENRNGVFINLNQVSEKTIQEIKVYIKYVKMQEKNISNFENIKKEFKKDFFTNIKKEDKDKNLINDKESINEIQT